jgi:hypothetical protein
MEGDISFSRPVRSLSGACLSQESRSHAAFRHAGTRPDANMRRTRWTRDWPCGFETTLCNVRDRPRACECTGSARCAHHRLRAFLAWPRAQRDGVPCKWKDRTRQSMLCSFTHVARGKETDAGLWLAFQLHAGTSARPPKAVARPCNRLILQGYHKYFGFKGNSPERRNWEKSPRRKSVGVDRAKRQAPT